MAYAYGSAVEGEIAEFGTMSGKSASILATGVLFNNMKFRNKSGNIDPKKLLLFDRTKLGCYITLDRLRY